MDHYSILDQGTPEQAPPAAAVPLAEPQRPVMSVSAAIAAANARAGSVLGHESPALRFPAEDNGQSLAEMAERDLDAALQLLSDRAQYITGATGAAIALRRKTHNDMICRASSGSNAPELGALLSAEFGLSGESVRKRSPLRCDDTERDPRVNREGCRQLGIASVVVMPIITDDEVLGIFELFSGEANAFTDRDMVALHRLGQMVETAVAMAEAAKAAPPQPTAEEIADGEDVPVDVEDVTDPVLEAEAVQPVSSPVDAALTAVETPAQEPIAKVTPPATLAPKVDPSKKPLFWSAALQTASAAKSDTDQSHVPPVLRNLKKCHACGFPITEGRLLCVECEEKKWKGQLRSSITAAKPASSSEGQSAAAVAPAPIPHGPAKPPATLSEALAVAAAKTAEDQKSAKTVEARVAIAAPKVEPVPSVKAPTPAAPITVAPLPATPVSVTSALTLDPAPTPVAEVAKSDPSSTVKNLETMQETAITIDSPILSAGISSSESWFSSNKYVIGALGLVAATVAAIAYLHH